MRVLVAGAAAIIILAGARAVADLLNPVLFAGFLALLFQPLLDRLRRFGGAAVFVVVLAVVVGGLALVGFIGISAREVAQQFPTYQAQIETIVQSLTRWLSDRNINTGSYVDAALRGPQVGRVVLNASTAVAGALGSVVLTLFVFAFMLGGMWEMERRASVDARDHSPLAARFIAFSATIRGYMGVRTLLGIATAVLNYLVLLVLGVDYALLWAVLSFLLSFVPNIGFVLSMIPPMLLGLLESGWVTALIVFISFQVINALIDNVIGPRFVGRQMKVSALVGFLSVLFWAWVLGPTGALLSVPLTVLLRDLAFSPGPSDATASNSPAPSSASNVG